MTNHDHARTIETLIDQALQAALPPLGGREPLLMGWDRPEPSKTPERRAQAELDAVTRWEGRAR